METEKSFKVGIFIVLKGADTLCSFSGNLSCNALQEKLHKTLQKCSTVSCDCAIKQKVEHV